MKIGSQIISCILLLALNNCNSNYITLEQPTWLEGVIENLETQALPFTLVYGGTQVRNADRLVAETAFTHVMLGSAPSETRQRIAPEHRAILWTGVAGGDKSSPWATEKSPWGNNIEAFHPKWQRTLARYAELQGDAGVKPAADFIVLDIEADRQGSRIIKLQSESTQLPTEKEALSAEEFAEDYKRSMLELSVKPVDFLMDNITSVTTRISSYGDVPISRNWYGIPKRSWKDWQTNRDVTNYMGLEGPDVINPFAAKLNVHTPSAYYFFPTGQNLAYLLFQVEANRAWTDKDIVIFVTPRFVGKSIYGDPISETLAEASTIFPFFSGANGLWLWEASKDRAKTNDPAVLPAYRGMFRGVERLGKFREFFVGDYELVIPKSGHAHFSDKDPVWRGVVNNGSILIAAQNPYQESGEESKLIISYGAWQQEIVLKGKEVFLQKFRL